MKYPDRIQAALLLSSRFEGLDAIAQEFVRLAEMKSGAKFTSVEHKPGVFLRLFNDAEDLAVSLEYVDGPAQNTLFAHALASPVTDLTSTDMDERIGSACSHILLEATHDALGGLEASPKIAAMMQQLGTAPHSATASAFNQRMETLATMARIACAHTAPNAVHWAQSNQLFETQAFEKVAAIGYPGPLGVHPMLFGEAPEVGLRTFGARHWLGREILVPPTALPWNAAYDSALDFIALAASDDGYVIPDGDTFGPEDESEVWRVHHREADISDAANDDCDASGGPAPIFELVPLRHDACAFLDEEYARETSVLMTRQPRGAAAGPEPLPKVESEDASCLAELEAALAEGIAEAAATPPETAPT